MMKIVEMVDRGEAAGPAFGADGIMLQPERASSPLGRLT